MNRHCRAEDVSAATYAEIVRQEGGHVMLQEYLNWGTEEKTDAFTLFCAVDRDVLPKTIIIENGDFILEARIIRETHIRYTKVV